MAKLFNIKRVNGISDDAVKEKTGRKWVEWFKVLDKIGARMMDHREIAARLHEEFGISPWWSQTVSVGYEQERGLRKKGQRGIRYSVAVSKTIGTPLAAVWDAWQDPALMSRWLAGAQFEFGSVKPQRVVHLTWPDGSRVTATITTSRGKTKVVVSHAKLVENAQVERVRTYWLKSLERLKAMLERAAPARPGCE